MDKLKIIEYIKSNGGARIPQLQAEFNLSYGEAKSIVDGLVAEGGLVYLSGVQYGLAEPFCGNTDGVEEGRRSYPPSDGAPLFRYVDDDDDDDSLFDDDDDEEYDYNDDMDARLAEYERFLRENMEDEEEEETEDDEDSEDECEYDGEEEDDEGEDFDELVARYMAKHEWLLGQRREAAQKLVDILSAVRDEKSAPVTPYKAPDISLWEDDEEEFTNAVTERLERLIKSDENMDLQAAIDKAECWLEAVRDTHDRRMVQVYEWLVYELKGHNRFSYEFMKKRFLS